MKLLLTAINAKYIHSNLAVYSLKAFAKEYKDSVEIAEFTINNQADYILEEIYKKKPDVLLFSCYIWNLSMIEAVMREFHKLCPTVPIWLGGPEVSFEVEDFLKNHSEVTGIMMGEGEETFRELCAYYMDSCNTDEGNSSNRLEDILGIAYRKENGVDVEIQVNPWRSIMNMSDIPFSYDKMEDFSNRIIYYESSRGCPFSCSYCLSSVDKKLRFRDINLVKDELCIFIEQKVPQVKFVDRTFNCHHEHAMEIWKFIHEHDNGVTNFHFEISADLINEEELALMEQMRPGLIQLEIGVQSTNEITIKEIKRTMKLERLKEIVKRVKRFGNIHQHLDLIAGLPFEDYKTFRKSFDEIYALRPNQLQMGFLKVLKGSYMFEHAKEYEILYHDNPPYEVLSTKWLSYEDVLRMKRVEEMLEVYYNSGQFEISMKVLETHFESAFDMFQKLGDFYEANGYFGMSHSRIRRCEILMEFLKQEWQNAPEGEEWQDCIRQALVFDLYYRENCKSRPVWANSYECVKPFARFYCKNGKMSHLEMFSYDFLGENYEELTDPVFVLFSYDKRDPLTHQAQIQYVNPDEDMIIGGADEPAVIEWQRKEQKKF
ncbi:MAG: B12-binding domain-containing radical SAM protein [Agathobacter sp.]|nr:B12-binding domain-containing radical SAM protein [Agathobacter sp.]